MPIGSIIAIYLVVWWLCLFVMLPLGVHNPLEGGGSAIRGTEPGAPVRANLLLKLGATTLLAGVFTALLFWGLSSPWLREYWS